MPAVSISFCKMLNQIWALPAVCVCWWSYSNTWYTWLDITGQKVSKKQVPLWQGQARFLKSYRIRFRSALLLLWSRYQRLCCTDKTQHCSGNNWGCPCFLACARKARQIFMFWSLGCRQSLNGTQGWGRVTSCPVPCCSWDVAHQAPSEMGRQQAAASAQLWFLIRHIPGDTKHCKETPSYEKPARGPYHWAGTTESWRATYATASVLLFHQLA